MYESRILKQLLKKRLDDAVEDIFEIFEKTIAEYEEQLRRQQRTLERVLNPDQALDSSELGAPEEPQEPVLGVVLKEEPEECALYSSDMVEQNGAPYSPEKREQESVPCSPDIHMGEQEGAPYSPDMGEEDSAPYGRDMSEPFEATGMWSSLQTGLSDSELTDHSSDQGLHLAPLSPGSDPTLYQVPASFRCSVCHQTLTTKSQLTDHLTTHVSGRQCLVCGLLLGQPGDVRRHMMIHSGEKPFSCESCGKRFTRKFGLQQHVKACRKENRLMAETPDEEGIFSCSVCSEIFTQKSLLTTHMMVHVSGTPGTCLVCNKVIGSIKGEVRRHMMGHTKEKPFTCKTCGKTFVRRATLRSHLNICEEAKALIELAPEEDDTFSCLFCNETFNRNTLLTDHMTTHAVTEETTAKCLICDKNISRGKNDIRRHMMIHSGEKPFSCETCGKRFNRKSTLQVHVNICNDGIPVVPQTPEKQEEEEEDQEEGTFSCSLCSADFSRKGLLTYHLTTHVSDPPGTCLICDKTIGCKRNDVRRHMMIHSGDKPFSCPNCGQKFSRKFTLRSHLNLCTKEAPLSEESPLKAPEEEETRGEEAGEEEEEEEKEMKCKICNKTFTQTSLLTDHMTMHTDETTGKCLVCDKEIGHTQIEIRNHMTLHSGEKPFSCKVCGKRFIKSLALRTHLKSHEKKPPPSPYQHLCSICGQGFKTTTVLKYHMFIHSGVRPFTCAVCGRKFRQQGDVRRHMMLHSGEKPFKCKVCERSFSRRNALRLHLRTHVPGGALNETLMEESSLTENDIPQVIICDSCGKGFTRNLHYQRHLKTCQEQNLRSADESRPYSCSICAETFADKQTLTDHVMTHKDGEYVSCGICNKSLLRHNLKTHLAVHAGERSHVCEICGKGFTRNTHLKGHMRTHAKDKTPTEQEEDGSESLACHICGKMYGKKSSLASHISENHRHPSSFKCPICGKFSRRKSDLKRHMLTHTGEKPFMCDLCGKGFTRNGLLRTHMNTHHRPEEVRSDTAEGQAYSCPVCAFPCKSYVHEETTERQFDCPSCQKTFLVKD